MSLTHRSLQQPKRDALQAIHDFEAHRNIDRAMQDLTAAIEQFPHAKCLKERLVQGVRISLLRGGAVHARSLLWSILPAIVERKWVEHIGVIIPVAFFGFGWGLFWLYGLLGLMP